ncbi:MAG: DNA-deoxyinosine glycosylase [Cellulosilyticaceae bacterium]
MIQSFKPVIDENSQILVLGSIPSVKSLEYNQYYGHPRNQFWKIIYTLFEKEYEEEYEQRLEFLLSNNIALWDVIGYCDREGSLDSAIKNEKINDFKWLKDNYNSINTIIFNGDKAFKTFNKYVKEPIEGITFYKVSSTSPAHTISFEKKLAEWSILKSLK